MTYYLDELLHKILCKLRLHKWCYYYDLHLNQDGTTKFCEYCEKEK